MSLKYILVRVAVLTLMLCAVGGVMAITFEDAIGYRYFGEIFGTLTSIGVICIAALACLRAVERERLRPLGWTGMIAGAAALPLMMATILIDDEFGRLGGPAMTVEIACGYIGLLALARLRPAMQWIFWATGFCVGTLAVFLCFVFAGMRPDEGLAKMMGILIILSLAGTATVWAGSRWGRALDERAPMSEYTHVTMTCPRCQESHELPAGPAKCPKCGLRVRTEFLPDVPE